MDIGERIRSIISQELPKSPFASLEDRTGINRNKWQNFYHGKQRATEEMIQAIALEWPHLIFWIITGEINQPEQISPLMPQRAVKADPADIHVERQDGVKTVNIPHLLNVRGVKYEQLDFDWGYYGIQPAELAANVLFHFGVSKEESLRHRRRFARDIISKLAHQKDIIRARTVRDWIKQNIPSR